MCAKQKVVSGMGLSQHPFFSHSLSCAAPVFSRAAVSAAASSLRPPWPWRSEKR